ncbi:lysophospholipid acyltransferase family protein [Desulfonema magnum]|uniref:Lipid A biosynthesis acyltransferase family protein n=1 Tax=Desulfonema magnum TaxID=45655 RepID=A0A975BFH0_9BACT|nr:lysophospholipid acyltransferase family protein [Desulfonema magnum]QTA84353.1 Lipid A biosynthesis acyltransferase family protein [Desulfonema magnum]
MEKIVFKIIVLCINLLGLIPKQWGDRMGCLLGRLFFIADAKHRKIAMQNLAYVFGKNPSQTRELSLKVFENLGKILFEAAWSVRLKQERFFKYFKIEGLSHVRDAYEKGRGVLILTAHFGNWELLAVIAAMLGYPISIVYRPLDFKPLDQFIVNSRSRFGAKLIHRRKALRKILRCLNRGEMVAMLMDQSVDWYEGVFVDFFGHRTCTNKGMALLAMKTEAPVVPVFLIREEFGFTGKFLPEIPLTKTGDKTKDVEINTEKYNKVIESVVREYPEQWFWVHRRWKIRPYSLWPRQ